MIEAKGTREEKKFNNQICENSALSGNEIDLEIIWTVE